MNGTGLLHLVPSSEGTSVQYLLGKDKNLNTVSEVEPIDLAPDRYFIERVLYLGTNQRPFLCNKIHPVESSYPSFFKTEFLISGYNYQILVGEFKNLLSVASYHDGSLAFHEYPAANIASHVEGPPDEAWTAQTWAVNSSECEYPYEQEISALNNQLNLLLNNFKDGTPLDKPGELLQLAEEVVNQKAQRTNEDIELWVANLSKDLAKHSD